jgi:HEAT repeat protein
MAHTTPFSAVIAALLDESKLFPARYLQRFSDIESVDLKAVLAAWPDVSGQRKQTLLQDLEDLAETDTLVSLDAFARALLTDPLAEVRLRALRILVESDEPRLIQAYRKLLRSDPDMEVRAAAAANLGHFVLLGELEKIPAEEKQEIEVDLMLALDSSKSQSVRQRALESLGYSGRAEVPALIEAAYQQKVTDWKVSALCAMGRSSDTCWSKQVLSQLHAPDEEVRIEAVRAAGELELEPARGILLDLLADEEDIEARKELVWALSRIGGQGVRARLEEMLDAETDDEEAEFLEEALDNLTFTEDLAQFGMFDFEADADEEAD